MEMMLYNQNNDVVTSEQFVFLSVLLLYLVNKLKKKVFLAPWLNWIPPDL